MEPFLSKSYLIPEEGLACGQGGEGLQARSGKLSSIKANRWPIQACQGPCRGTSGAGGVGDRQLPSEAPSLALRPAQDPERGRGNPARASYRLASSLRRGDGKAQGDQVLQGGS